MKTAIVFVNLGTPSQPTAKSVRKFLREFLSDRRGVEIPRPIWLAILYLFILPFRPKKVAEGYKQTFIKGHSPLRLYSEELVSGVNAQFKREMGSQAPSCRLAMTYGDGNISQVSDELIKEGAESILYVPLFPQYSATTTAAVLDKITAYYQGKRDICQWHWLRDYHQHPLYIEALAESLRSHWQEHGQAQQLLMSFHGIPQRNIDLGDPYFEQCTVTANLLAKSLELKSDQWQLSFQSRLGRAKWLQPYSIDSVTKLGQKKLAKLDVIAPAFAVDCLETLEEIQGELAEAFVDNGGGQLRYVPCLNASEQHQRLFVALCKPYLTLGGRV